MKQKLENHIDEAVPLYIFARSFKTFVHLIENVDEDIKLLWRGSRLLNTQLERQLTRPISERQPEYHYGPLIMQAFSYMRLPIVAKEVKILHFYSITDEISHRLFAVLS